MAINTGEIVTTALELDLAMDAEGEPCRVEVHVNGRALQELTGMCTAVDKALPAPVHPMVGRIGKYPLIHCERGGDLDLEPRWRIVARRRCTDGL